MSTVPRHGDEETVGPVPRRGRRIASAVLQWVTGEAVKSTFGRVVRIKKACHQEAALALLTQEDVLLFPSQDVDDAPTFPENGPLLIPYQGVLEEPGDVAWFGKLRVQLEDYASIPFLPLNGATVARLRNSSGWRAYLEDADAARKSGRFVSQLSGHTVAIAGIPSVGSNSSTPVASVDIDGDGVARLGMDGLTLGDLSTFEALRNALDQSYPATARLGALDGDIASDVALRPWLSLYRAGITFATPTDSGPVWSVVGLGSSLYENRDIPQPVRGDLLLMHRGDERVLVEPETLRRFALNRTVALAVEWVLSTGSDKDPAMGLLQDGAPTSDGFVRQVIEQFHLNGINLRRRR